MRIIKTKIRGLRHVFGEPGKELMIAKLKPGDKLDLVPEPDNPRDLNAIAVYHQKIKFGYLSRELAKDLKNCLERTTAKVDRLTGQAQGVNILIEKRTLFDK